MKIILDMDNTMGISSRDVDDGLTFLYLLGREDVEILAVTTTFGNDGAEVTYSNTGRMIDELGLEPPPELIGGTEGETGPGDNPAATRIVELLDLYDDVYMIALGSLRNPADAERSRPGILKRLKGLISMGGVYERLYVDGTSLDELNYSCDPDSTRTVLESGVNFINAGANFCLDMRFGKKERDILNEDTAIYRYIRERCSQWFSRFEEDYGNGDIVIWDLNCAVYLTDPQLFRTRKVRITTHMEDLSWGHLRLSEEGHEITSMMEVMDRKEYFNKVFSAWRDLERKAELPEF